MPEDTNMVENDATQGAPAEKTFTQAEMDAIIGERLNRLKAKYADYDELKGKAAKFDEAEEASKSELQKAVEERDKLRARLDALEAEKARAEAVAKAAAEHGVDAALLARMSGDVEENALFLKGKNDAEPKHGFVPDNGEANVPAPKKKEIPKVI
ncbi:MAG: hypothetical protein IKP01_02175 [Bacteroidales bacterium]|nr:hypothetical protein [Bacteroidales bacterium]